MTYDLLTRHLVREEGIRLEPYKCSAGWWTIGVGHLIDSRKGGKIPPGVTSFPISREMAFLILQNDIHNVECDLWREIPWIRSLSPVRQAVFASMCFQMGVFGLLGFKRALKHAKNGQFSSAAFEMLDSTWNQQTPERAARLSNAMGTSEPFFLTGSTE